MRVDVDKDKCVGCGLCVNISPKNFRLDDDGTAHSRGSMSHEVADRVVNDCPVEALSRRSK